MLFSIFGFLSYNDLFSLSLSSRYLNLSVTYFLLRLPALDLSSHPSSLSLLSLSSLLSRCPALHSLRIRFVGELHDLSIFRPLLSLSTIEVAQCPLSHLNGISHLSHLTSLDVSHAHQIGSLQPLAACRALRHLDISHLYKIMDVTPLACLKEWRYVNMSYCHNIRDFNVLLNSPHLNKLEFRSFHHTPPHTPFVLPNLPKLEHLDLEGVRGHPQLIFPFSSQSPIRRIDLSNGEVQIIEFWNTFENLTWLNMSNMRGVMNFHFLQMAPNMEYLEVKRCENLSLLHLTSLTKLQFLHFSQNGLQDLSPLHHLLSLQSLNIEDMHIVNNLNSLLISIPLLSLYMRNCSFYFPTLLTPHQAHSPLQSECDTFPLSIHTDLQQQHSSGVPHLSHLDIKYCKLAHLDFLQSLLSLTTLLIGLSSEVDSGSPPISLRPLSKLANLRTLRLENLHAATEHLSLTSLCSLIRLELVGLREIFQFMEAVLVMGSLQVVRVAQCERGMRQMRMLRRSRPQLQIVNV